MLEELYSIYAQEYQKAAFSYKMMGLMLDEDAMKERVDVRGIDTIYIYGGGYLGVQLYNALKNKICVKAIVDKSGGLSVNAKGIKTISIEDLKRSYKGEKIIITPFKYYDSIKKDLSYFVDERDIFFIGELFGEVK